MSRTRTLLVVAAMAAAVACGDSYGTGPDVPAPARVVTAAGDVTAAVAEFRTVLGDPVNGGAAGSQPAGRREISWDGVPADLTNNELFPGDFFNARAPRGVVFTTPGTGFRISDNNVADLDPSFAQEFAFFSPRKTFLAAGSNVMDADFRVPAGSDAASVRGFGVVFADVDRPNSATLEFFGREGSLGRFEAPVRSSAGPLSFLGVAFDSKIVTRVRITSGRAAVTAGGRDISGGGASDLVIMDDFLFDEPQAVR
jgi:hypothetical protein